MSRWRIGISVLLAAVALGGCMVSDVESYFPDPAGSAGAGGSNDAGADTAVDSASTVDGSAEASPDVSADAPSTDGPAVDGNTEASNEAAADALVEAANDAPADAPKEAAIDSPADAPTDTSIDAPADGPKDAGVDAPVDAPADAPTDAPIDVMPVSLADCALLLHFENTDWAADGGVTDNSGLGNHGTVSGGVAGYVPGKFGQAADFDGGYIMIGDKLTLRPTTKITYAAWIYPTAVASNASGIISKRDGYGTQEAFTLFIDTTTKLTVDIQTSGNRFVSDASVTVPASSWRHVAVVYDGAQATPTASIYLDGELDTTTTVDVPDGSISPYTSPLVIGDLPNGGGRFTGRIDEVAIWMRALSANEIRALFNATGPL